MAGLVSMVKCGLVGRVERVLCVTDAVCTCASLGEAKSMEVDELLCVERTAFQVAGSYCVT